MPSLWATQAATKSTARHLRERHKQHCPGKNDGNNRPNSLKRAVFNKDPRGKLQGLN